MTEVVEIISRLEEAGGSLTLAGDRIRYTIPQGNAEAHRIVAELRSRRGDVKAVLRERSSRRETTTVDPYKVRLRAVLEQAQEPDYSMGMIHWLESAHPDLYRDITSTLPDRIHELWIARAPLPEFERVTAKWLAAHRKACALFRARKQ